MATNWNMRIVMELIPRIFENSGLINGNGFELGKFNYQIKKAISKDLFDQQHGSGWPTTFS